MKLKKRVICGIFAVLLAWFGTGELRMQRNLAEEVFRFHVIANSDSEHDQALKLKVKESIIAYMEEELPDSDSVETTKEWAVSNMQEIERIAKETLRRYSCDHEVRGSIENCYFPDKSYGDVTFPKGYYDALRIEIGEGKGANWWCVLYPNLCFLDAVHAVVPEEGKEKLRQVLDEEEYNMITAFSEFRIGWFFF